MQFLPLRFKVLLFDGLSAGESLAFLCPLSTFVQSIDKLLVIAFPAPIPVKILQPQALRA